MMPGSFGFDFSDASSVAVHCRYQWSAKAFNIARIILGNSLTLRILRRLPFRKGDGLLVWSPKCVHVEGEYALLWQSDKWFAFIVARADSDVQLRAFREGGVTWNLHG